MSHPSDSWAWPHQPHILVAGAGAIGCSLATRLAAANQRASLLARGTTLAAVQAQAPHPDHMSDAEWQLRVQLAHCYHLVNHFGWTETIFNHISARVPGSDFDFYGAQLHGREAYHTFEGVTLFADEKSRMLASLGDKHVLVLRNHGVAVGEMDVPRAFFLLWTVQRAAEIQCAASAMAGDNVPLPEAISRRCAALTAQLIREDGFTQKFFDAMVRQMHGRRGRRPASGG